MFEEVAAVESCCWMRLSGDGGDDCGSDGELAVCCSLLPTVVDRSWCSWFESSLCCRSGV